MFTPTAPAKRKKMNFMINENLVIQLTELVPAGERSDFVNGVLDEELRHLARRRASAMIDKAREEFHWHMSDKEVRKAREYGRM